MKERKNIIFDMGKVLLQYDPWISLDYFCNTEEEKEIIHRELFQSPIWTMADEGKITNGQRYDLAKDNVPPWLHQKLKLVVENWDMCMKEVPGAKEFVNKAKAKGYGCYVLSNACNRFYHYFPVHFSLDTFEKVIVSSEIKMVKPDPEIYKYLLSTCGLKAEECVFLDDVKENIEAAQSLGIQGILFENDYSKIQETLHW